MGRSTRVLAGLVLGTLTASAWAQDETDPENARPGVVAQYAATPDGPAVAQRVETDLTHDWGDARPDPRLPAGPFAAHWSGAILVREPGPHRFFVRSDGPVALTVDGQAVRVGTADGAEPEAVDLPPGLVTIAVQYRHERGPARFALDWEGPTFGREPLPAWVLYHDGGLEAEGDPFEAGRRLADRLGCANCHAVLDLPTHRDHGPPLRDAGHAIDPAWLAAWLADPTRLRAEPRMPGFGEHGLDRQQVADVIAFLAALPKSEPVEPTGELKMALNVADPASGRLLFRTIGCLGCHTRQSEGLDFQPIDRAAPDLSDLGRKRSADWIASYLARPNPKTPARHRPDLHVRPDDAAHLAAYLVSDPPSALIAPEPPAGDARRGREVVESYRCASCHEIAGLKPRAAGLPLKAGSNPKAGCLADGGRAANVPRYALRDDQRAALRAFVAGLPEQPSPTPDWTRAEDAMRRRNCFGCHVRDGRGGHGLGPQIAEYLARDPQLGAFKGRLTPPDLTAVGDKLRPDYLDQAIRGAAPSARPWLSVKMPVFAFEPGEAEAIAAFLKGHDGMASDSGTTRTEPGPKVHPELAAPEKAAALIGQRGFGCVSCHVLAGKIPPGGEPETLGPDLALAHQRMSRRYFRRWIADPQRIIPGTPMPQFLQPVATQPGTLDDQLGAIWQVLGRKDLEELASFGTREIRRPSSDRAEVVRDMVLVPDGPESVRYYPRAVAIGFSNGQSLLFDTDRLSWISWWHQGFLSRTKSGRLWEWHPEGANLWNDTGGDPPVWFVGPVGKVIPPGEVRERFGSFRLLAFEGPGVVLKYDLNGPGESKVRVAERIMPADGGWSRMVRVSGLPEGWRPVLDLPATTARAEIVGDRLRWKAGNASVDLRLSPEPEPGAATLPMEPAGEGSYRAELRLTITPAS